jgi:asparagine synthase (glutamine-hydrolysing)
MAARRAVTVAISGNGGDELFAGYPWFIFMARDQLRRKSEPWNAMARSLIATIARRRALDRLMRLSGGRVLARARGLAGFVTRYGNTYQIFGAWGAARLLSAGLRDEAEAGRALDHDLNRIDEVPNGTTVQRVTGLCLRGYNNNQLLRDTDAVSMAHSLEVRVPFLDPVVVDTALALPDSAKMAEPSDLASTEGRTYRDTGAKRVLIDAGQGRLPKDFDLQPKRGFAMPFDSWLAGPLNEVLLDTLSEGRVRSRGLLDPGEVATVRQSVIEGRFVWTQPWLLMMLELWHREVLDRAGSEASSSLEPACSAQTCL